MQNNQSKQLPVTLTAMNDDLTASIDINRGERSKVLPELQVEPGYVDIKRAKGEVFMIQAMNIFHEESKNDNAFKTSLDLNIHNGSKIKLPLFGERRPMKYEVYSSLENISIGSVNLETEKIENYRKSLNGTT